MVTNNKTPEIPHSKWADPSPPAPRWTHERTASLRNSLHRITRGVSKYFVRYVLFRGDKVKYLRHLGVRIGSACSIITDVGNFRGEPWLIEIGNRVTVAGGAIFLTHDGSSRVFRHLLPSSSPFGNRFGTIKVLDNSFIGAEALILPDVQIGPNSIVGACSLVNKSVPANTVVAGIPARHICTLDEYVESYLKKMIPIEATDRESLRKELTLKLWGEIR